MEKEVEDFKKLMIYLTIYHREVAIEEFKKDRHAAYLKMVNSVSVGEVSNSHKIAGLYHSMLREEEIE